MKEPSSLWFHSLVMVCLHVRLSVGAGGGRFQLRYRKGKKSGDLSDSPVVCSAKLIME